MIDQLGASDIGDLEISNWLKKSKKVDSITRLPGDASTRKYYRIQSGSQSYIVMSMESFETQKDQLPFLVMQKHLARFQIDVPAVLDSDPKKGLILLEDLGDVTLLRRLQDVSTPDIERHLYERVLDSLVQLQVHSSPKKKDQSLEAFKMRFDQEKLMWEINFTIENFYQGYSNRNIPPRDLNIITKGFEEICSELAAQPTVLTHRDFHSRNIMVTPTQNNEVERLVMIDFQDARMGPAQYDLASLLKDSYYQLEEAQVSFLIDYYIARFEALAQKPIDRNHFIYIFDLMAIQRNFKAIGSFASFLNKRGNPSYLKFIGNTFENIRRNLLKYPKYSKLREVLFHYYYF